MSVSTIDFGPWSTKLGGTVQATKKMIQIDNSPGPGRNNGETAVFLRFAENPFFLLRKNTRNPLKDWFIWEKATFLFAQLCPVVVRTWCCVITKCLFFWAQKLGFSPKILFLLQDPKFCQWPVWSPRQKVFPHPTSGAPSASNSLSISLEKKPKKSNKTKKPEKPNKTNKPKKPIKQRNQLYRIFQSLNRKAQAVLLTAGNWRNQKPLRPFLLPHDAGL